MARGEGARGPTPGRRTPLTMERSTDAPGLDAPDAAASTRGVVSSAAVVFLGNLVARGLGFLFPLVVARATDRADFALVYFFVTTGFTVGELALASYPTALTRFLAAAGRDEPAPWLPAAVVAGLPLLGASIVLGEILAAGAAAPAGLLSLVVVGLTIDAYYFGVLRGLRRFGWLVLYRIGANLAQILLLLAAVLLDAASVGTVVAIYAGVYLLAIAAIEAAVGPVRGLLRRSTVPDRTSIRHLTAFAIPALVSGTAYAAILGLDVFFVRLFAPGELADYGAARSLAMPMTLVSYAIGVILLPHAAAAGGAVRRRLLGQAVATTAILGLLGVVAYAVLGPPVLAVVFPEDYRAAGGSLVLLAAAIGLMGGYSVLSQWWMGTGRPGPAAASLVVGALAAAAAHLVLTAQLGARGAALSTAIGALTAIAVLAAATVRHPDATASGTRHRPAAST
jgi:O-antigen/teichoic acid export membrane protein